MFVHTDEKKPIKIWLQSKEALEDACLEQAKNLANLPFIHKHVALMPDCLTEDAEILTLTGFKFIKDLAKGEVVANYNPKSGALEWHPVKDIIVRNRKPTEKIYRFDFGMLNTSMILSENHRMAYKAAMGVKAKDLPKATKIKEYQWEVTGVSNPVQVEHKLTFEEILLLLWVVGDGSIHRGNWGDRIKFGLKKERKIRRVTELLDTIGLDYSVSTSKKETSVIITVQDSLKYINILGEGKTYPFDIIHSLNKEKASQVLEEMVQIDGDYESYKAKGTLRFNTSREADVNFITTIISMYYGVATVKSRRTESDYGVCDMWYVNAIPYNSFEFSKNGMHNREVVRTEVEDYTGDLVCVTCDTGYFIAKQGGMTFISGNCHTGYGMPVGGVIATKGVIIPNAVGVDIGCVDKDTEYLTPAGWKKISEYVDGDSVMVYDLETNSSFYETPSYVKQPCDEFYRIKTKYGVDQKLSEEHNLLMFKGRHHRKKQWGVPYSLQMKEVYTQHNELKLGFRDKMLAVLPNAKLGEKSVGMTDAQIRVQVMVMADGHIMYEPTNYCRCKFKKARKVERCEMLLKTAGIQYVRHTGADGSTSFQFNAPVKDKRISYFWGASVEQLNIIIDELFYWDGWFEKKNVYFTNHREDADFVQYALAVCGFRSTINIDAREGRTTGYRVLKSNTQYVGFAGTPKTDIVIEDSEDGYKYCFTTSTGYWVMRRNGCIAVTGNCGMAYIGTDLKLSDIQDIQTKSGSLTQVIIGDFLRNIPVGFAKHSKPQASEVLDKAKEELHKYEANPELLPCIEAGYFQVGTLGGGNHFLELQVDDEGFIGLMVHSGSRNFGKQICDNFNKKAVQLNALWHSSVPAKHDLAFLPTDTVEGQQYINWMNLALDYAYENRSRMIKVASELLIKHVLKHTGITVNLTEEINCHHNYAAIEHHYGQNVWVHRKGATRARAGEVALIPGAMGSYSYVVAGLGNSESFHSCSHGAGRQYSRRAALEKFSAEEVMVDLKTQGVVLGKHNKADVAEESRFAYKDISEVMDNQKDLVRAIKRLRTVGVIKG